MAQTMARPLSVLAPAKINLYLHVTGLRDDGYHLLDSLVAFADCGDRIEIEPAPSFSFRITGPFASAFIAAERDETPESGNIAVRAAWLYAKTVGRDLSCRMTLVKNMPLAAGIGGGSSDAAAVLWALAAFWGLPCPHPQIMALAAKLGADVPVCLAASPARMSGIGDILEPVAFLPDLPVVLVNPARPCPTPAIFRLFDRHFSGFPDKALPPAPDFPATPEAMTGFLQGCRNDLEEAAITHVPDIAAVLQSLKGSEGCRLARMSGSGATCFGLYENEFDATEAAAGILQQNPSWWVRSAMLNRAARY